MSSRIERRLRKIARLNTAAEVSIMRWTRFELSDKYKDICARARIFRREHEQNKDRLVRCYN
ncbi:MAG: hypothetical protein WC966_10725 [Bradymonadales bacterium]